MSDAPARSWAFASTVFECNSRRIASLVHGFSVFIHFARSNVHRFAAYPAKMKYWREHFGLPLAPFIRLHKRPTPEKARRRVVCLTSKL